MGLCYGLYSDTWIVKSGHLMELLKSADTWSGRLSRLCHCHGDVLGVVEMKGCQGEFLGSLRVCWKRYTESCWLIKKGEPAREKKLKAFLLAGVVVLVQVSWRASASLLVPAGVQVQVCCHAVICWCTCVQVQVYCCNLLRCRCAGTCVEHNVYLCAGALALVCR